MQFARSAFVSQLQESRIQALRNFFGQKGHRPPKSEGARMPMFSFSKFSRRRNPVIFP